MWDNGGVQRFIRLFSHAASLPLVIAVWVGSDILGRIEIIARLTSGIRSFVVTQAGEVSVLLGSVVWLAGVVAWPDIKRRFPLLHIPKSIHERLEDVERKLETPFAGDQAVTPQKLKIVIVRGIVGKEPQSPNYESSFNGTRSTWLLLRVRVNSMSEPGVTINKWTLRMATIGSNGDYLSPPDIQEASSWLGYATDEEPEQHFNRIDKRLDHITRTSEVRYGPATEGWILFSTWHEPYELFGMCFELTAHDDFDGVSTGDRSPGGDWLKPGRFDNHPMPPGMLSGFGSPRSLE